MTSTTDHIVEATGLERVFRTRQVTVTAVAGLDLAVPRGSIVGLLGPNGAGKTTTLRMLTTLLLPTAGEITVVGRDPRRDPVGVRRHIGYVAQGGSIDPQLRVREELLQQCRLYGMDLRSAERRTTELCQHLDLTELAARPLATLSGGQRRRAEIALGLVHQPELILLDEPTLGLDPQNRSNVWDHIQRAREEYGTTVLLSTNYLDEADVLCDEVLIVDRGRLVARGSPAELKQRVAGDVITIEPNDTQGAHDVLVGSTRRGDAVRDVTVTGHALRLQVDDGDHALPELLGALSEAGVHVEAIRLWRPTLDDVFFSVTGRSVHDDTDPEPSVRSSGVAAAHA